MLGCKETMDTIAVIEENLITDEKQIYRTLMLAKDSDVFKDDILEIERRLNSIKTDELDPLELDASLSSIIVNYGFESNAEATTFINDVKSLFKRFLLVNDSNEIVLTSLNNTNIEDVIAEMVDSVTDAQLKSVLEQEFTVSGQTLKGVHVLLLLTFPDSFKHVDNHLYFNFDPFKLSVTWNNSDTFDYDKSLSPIYKFIGQLLSYDGNFYNPVSIQNASLTVKQEMMQETQQSTDNPYELMENLKAFAIDNTLKSKQVKALIEMFDLLKDNDTLRLALASSVYNYNVASYVDIEEGELGLDVKIKSHFQNLLVMNVESRFREGFTKRFTDRSKVLANQVLKKDVVQFLSKSFPSYANDIEFWKTFGLSDVIKQQDGKVIFDKGMVVYTGRDNVVLDSDKILSNYPNMLNNYVKTLPENVSSSSVVTLADGATKSTKTLYNVAGNFLKVLANVMNTPNTVFEAVKNHIENKLVKLNGLVIKSMFKNSEGDLKQASEMSIPEHLFYDLTLFKQSEIINKSSGTVKKTLFSTVVVADKKNPYLYDVEFKHYTNQEDTVDNVKNMLKDYYQSVVVNQITEILKDYNTVLGQNIVFDKSTINDKKEFEKEISRINTIINNLTDVKNLTDKIQTVNEERITQGLDILNFYDKNHYDFSAKKVGIISGITTFANNYVFDFDKTMNNAYEQFESELDKYFGIKKLKDAQTLVQTVNEADMLKGFTQAISKNDLLEYFYKWNYTFEVFLPMSSGFRWQFKGKNDVKQWIVQIKRNVILSSSFIPYQTEINNEALEKRSIAITLSSDKKQYVESYIGESSNQEFTDGSMFTLMLDVYKQQTSLLKDIFNIPSLNKKDFGVSFDARFGTATLFKRANFALTNRRIRNSQYLQDMLKKMTDEPAFAKFKHSKSVSYTFNQSVKNKSKGLYKVGDISLTKGTVMTLDKVGDTYTLTIKDKKNKEVRFKDIKSIYDLYQAFGGWGVQNGFDSDTSWLLVKQIMLQIGDESPKYVGSLIFPSSMKTGQSNIDTYSWIDNTFTGLQFNHEHETEDSTLKGLTQVISSSLMGNRQDLGLKIMDTLAMIAELKKVKVPNDLVSLISLLRKNIDSSITAANTIINLQTPSLSNANIFQRFATIMQSVFSDSVIRNILAGNQSILSPSFTQLYEVPKVRKIDGEYQFMVDGEWTNNPTSLVDTNVLYDKSAYDNYIANNDLEIIKQKLNQTLITKSQMELFSFGKPRPLQAPRYYYVVNDDIFDLADTQINVELSAARRLLYLIDNNKDNLPIDELVKKDIAAARMKFSDNPDKIKQRWERRFFVMENMMNTSNLKELGFELENKQNDLINAWSVGQSVTIDNVEYKAPTKIITRSGEILASPMVSDFMIEAGQDVYDDKYFYEKLVKNRRFRNKVLEGITDEEFKKLTGQNKNDVFGVYEAGYAGTMIKGAPTHDNALRAFAKWINANHETAREVFVARIPSQHLQSWMSTKIVGYLDEDNTIEQPAEMLWLQGADLDIDKGNIPTYSYKNGKIIAWNTDMIKVSRDKVEIDVKAPLDKEYISTLSEKDKELALLNFVVASLNTIIRDISNANLAGTPIAMSDLDDYSKSEEVDKLLPNSPHSVAKMTLENSLGKKAIGITASAIKSYASILVSAYKNNFSMFKLFNPITITINQSKKTVKGIFGLTTGSNFLQDKDVQQAVSQIFKINIADPEQYLIEAKKILNQEQFKRKPAIDTLSQILSAATDNAKELKLGAMNADPNTTLSAYLYGVMIGLSLDEINTIMKDPSVLALTTNPQNTSHIGIKRKFKIYEIIDKAESDILLSNKAKLQTKEAIINNKKTVYIPPQEYTSSNLKSFIDLYRGGEKLAVLSQTLGINQGLGSEYHQNFTVVARLEDGIRATVPTITKRRDSDAITRTALPLPEGFDLQTFLTTTDGVVMYRQLELYNDYFKEQNIPGFNMIQVIADNPSYRKLLGLTYDLRTIYNKHTYKAKVVESLQSILRTMGMNLSDNIMRNMLNYADDFVAQSFVASKLKKISKEDFISILHEYISASDTGFLEHLTVTNDKGIDTIRFTRSLFTQEDNILQKSLIDLYKKQLEDTTQEQINSLGMSLYDALTLYDILVYRNKVNKDSYSKLINYKTGLAKEWIEYQSKQDKTFNVNMTPNNLIDMFIRYGGIPYSKPAIMSKQEDYGQIRYELNRDVIASYGVSNDAIDVLDKKLNAYNANKVLFLKHNYYLNEILSNNTYKSSSVNYYTDYSTNEQHIVLSDGVVLPVSFSKKLTYERLNTFKEQYQKMTQSGIDIQLVDTKFLLDNNLSTTAKAFKARGVIYINTDLANGTELLHEYAHLYIDTLKQSPSWNRIVEEVKQSPLYKLSDEQDEDVKIEETLVYLILNNNHPDIVREELGNIYNTVFGVERETITNNDKIIWGHPAIGKTTVLETNPDLFIDFDDEFNKTRDKWIENKSNTRKGTVEFKKAKNEILINYDKYPDFMEFAKSEWNKAKQKANQSNKKLLASSSFLLEIVPNDFDRVINMSDETFIQRNIDRNAGSLQESTDWKKGINEKLKKIPSDKIITTDKYIGELLPKQLTDQQKQNIQELKQLEPAYAVASDEKVQEFIESIYPESKVKDVLFHGTNANLNKGFSKSTSGSGSGSPIMKGDIYATFQPETTLQYIKGLGTQPDKMWTNQHFELKRLLDEKNRSSPISEDIINTEFKKGKDKGKSIETLKQEYNFTGTNVDFVKFVYGLKEGESFNEYKKRKLIEFKEILKAGNLQKSPYVLIMDIKNPLINSNQDTDYTEFIKAAEQNGNDGLIMYNNNDAFNSDVAVAFEPEQVTILNSPETIQKWNEFLSQQTPHIEQMSLNEVISRFGTDEMKDTLHYKTIEEPYLEEKINKLLNIGTIKQIEC
jgi:hypothetical protein